MPNQFIGSRYARKARVVDGPPMGEAQQCALMVSILARFDHQPRLSSTSIAILCGRSANQHSGKVGKPVQALIDRMVEIGYLVQLPPSPIRETPHYRKGDVDLEKFKERCAAELQEWEFARNRNHVFK